MHVGKTGTAERERCLLMTSHGQLDCDTKMSTGSENSEEASDARAQTTPEHAPCAAKASPEI